MATIGFMAGNIFYDSLLPAVANRDKVDYVSALGYSLGYLGGGLCFMVNVLMYLHPDWFGILIPPLLFDYHFFLLLSGGVSFLYLLFFLPEPESNDTVPLHKAISAGLAQLKQTYNHIREMKIIGTFLLAFWLYEDGVATIVRMAVKIGSSLGFAAGDLITAILMVQFIGFPAALLYNWFAKNVGIKNAVLIAIGVME